MRIRRKLEAFSHTVRAKALTFVCVKPCTKGFGFGPARAVRFSLVFACAAVSILALLDWRWVYWVSLQTAKQTCVFNLGCGE